MLCAGLLVVARGSVTWAMLALFLSVGTSESIPRAVITENMRRVVPRIWKSSRQARSSLTLLKVFTAGKLDQRTMDKYGHSGGTNTSFTVLHSSISLLHLSTPFSDNFLLFRPTLKSQTCHVYYYVFIYLFYFCHLKWGQFNDAVVQFDVKVNHVLEGDYFDDV